MKRRPGHTRFWLLVGQATVGLTFVLPGCEPINAEIAQEFVLEFARGALTAWLL